MGKKLKATNRRSGTNGRNENNGINHDPTTFESESYGDNDSAGGWGNRSFFSMNNGSDTINDNLDDDHTTNFNYNDDDDDEMIDDRIIQRGDPGDENLMLITSNRIQIIQDTIQLLCDIIHEKRTIQRENILRKCYKVLTLYGTSCGTIGYNIVISNCNEIIDSCLFSLRPRQSSNEQYATCRCIEIISIILCNNENCIDQWISSLHESLRHTIISSSRSTYVRMAALRALSITVFCTTITIGVTTNHNTDNDGMAIESLLDLCEAIGTNHEYRNHSVPTTLRATAIDCWSLLASTLDDWTISGQDEIFIGRGTAILSSLKDALDDTKLESAELRSSTAQCLSLIHEARVNIGVIDTSYEKGTHNTNDNENVETNDIETKDKLRTMNNATARRYQKGSWDGSRYEVLMDEVKQRVSELANESSHRISKKDKKEQRSNFREYVSTLVDDESPELVINFRNNSNNVTTLSSWKTIIPLNMIRQSLQSGYQTQLLSNPVLQHYFNIQHSMYDNSSNYNNTMSQIEKRLLLSKSGETYKIADQDRRKKRDKRENIKNHFLTADGDDI